MALPVVFVILFPLKLHCHAAANLTLSVLRATLLALRFTDVACCGPLLNIGLRIQRHTSQVYSLIAV